MKIAAQKINNRGITISKHKLDVVTKFYDKVYGLNAYRLYDMGYSENPSVVDMVGLKYAIRDEFPEEFSYLVLNNNKLMDTDFSIVCDYARKKAKDEEAKKVLTCLYMLQTAIDAQKCLDKVAKSVKIPVRKNSVTIKSRLAFSSRTLNASAPYMDNPYSHDIIEGEKSGYLKRFYFGEAIIHKIMLDSGLSEEEYQAHLKTGDSFILGGITQQEELEFIPLIYNSSSLTGKYAELFKKRYAQYYNDFYTSQTNSTDCMTYEEYIAVQAMSDCIDSVKKLRETQDFLEEVYVNQYYLTYLSSTPNTITEDTISVGVFTMLDSSKSFGIESLLEGFCGEFISESKADSLGYKKLGRPVEIGGVMCYPLYRLSTSNDLSVHSIYRDNISFNYSRINKFVPNCTVASSDDYIAQSDAIFSYISSTTSNVGVACLLTALICASCGLVEPTIVYSRVLTNGRYSPKDLITETVAHYNKLYK